MKTFYVDALLLFSFLSFAYRVSKWIYDSNFSKRYFNRNISRLNTVIKIFGVSYSIIVTKALSKVLKHYYTYDNRFWNLFETVAIEHYFFASLSEHIL